MAYWSMKKRVEGYRKATGRKAKEVPDTLIELERQIKILKAEIEDLKKKGESEAVIGRKVVELGSVEVEYKRLIKQFDERS